MIPPVPTIPLVSQPVMKSELTHTAHAPHLQKLDQDRHDSCGHTALTLAVDLAKSRAQAPEADDVILARAKVFRDFLKEATC